MAEKSQKKGAGRHTKQCSLCRHSQLDQIEYDFTRKWLSGDVIREKYKGFSEQSFRNHVDYMELEKIRDRHKKDAVMENVLLTFVRPKNGHSDGRLYLEGMRFIANLNDQGQYVEHSEVKNTTDAINSLTREEQAEILQSIQQTGDIPERFKRMLLGDPKTEEILKGRKEI